MYASAFASSASTRWTRAWSGARAESSSADSSASSNANSRNPFAASRANARASDPFGSSAGTSSARVNPFASGGSAVARREGGGGSGAAAARRPSAAYPSFEDAVVYEVPERLRRPNAERVDAFVRYGSLEDVFPGSGLADAFHSNARFRTEIRRAMRDDLFVPDDSLSAERNAAMRSLSSSVHVNWFESRTGYAALSELFARSGVDLTGERFIKGLGALCGTPCHGTLIDIASIGKQNIRHSWHQDSGYDRYTVMLGFPSSTPSEDLPEGVGVFTHAVKLSHPLAQQHAEGSVIQWENYVPYEGDFDAKYIARPVFKRGQELMIYRDSSHLHSAPDASHREAVWRFM